MGKAHHMWKNTTEMAETVQRAGVDVKRTGWKCNACDNVFWNRNKSRMIQHLTGDASRCSGIEPCTKADAALRKLAVASLNLDEDKKDLTKKRSAEREGIADAEDAARAGLVQQKLKHKTVAVCEVEGAQAPAGLQRAGIRRRAPWSIIPIILIILIRARVNYT